MGQVGSVRKQKIAVRQARLIELARSIAPMANKTLDDNDVRSILRAIVRRWSTTEVAVYRSRDVMDGAAAHIEHVVPVRVIVDRMIAKPRTCERLLRTCVILAEVTPDEHCHIGTMLVTHSDLYTKMKACRIDEVVDLGWRRYRRRGIKVFDAGDRLPWRRRR